MSSIKDTIKQSLTNFANSLKETYTKKNDIIDNLDSTDSTKPLSANMGNSIKNQIDILDSNKISHGFAIGTTNVLYRAYNSGGLSTSNGFKTLVIVTDSDSMAYSIFLVKYIHGTSLEISTMLNGGIGTAAYNKVGTVTWSGVTGIANVMVIPSNK